MAEQDDATVSVRMKPVSPGCGEACGPDAQRSPSLPKVSSLLAGSRRLSLEAGSNCGSFRNRVANPTGAFRSLDSVADFLRGVAL